MSQANRRGIGGHKTQSLPPGRRNVGLDGAKELEVEFGEDIGTQLMACLVKRLRGNLTYPVGLIAQRGEEKVQFGLNGTPDARQEKRHQGGERKLAVAGEKLRFKPGCVEKIVRF